MLENYEKFTQGQKSQFSDVANKLLVNTFLSRSKENNKVDFYFVVNYKEIFDEFFSVLGYELMVDVNEGVIMLEGANSNQSLKLKRDETLVLLILRILYHEKMKETSLNENIVISVEDIHTKYNYLEIKRRINKTDLINSLRLFRRFNIIEILGDINQSSCRVIILPTILYAINTENVSEVYNSIQKIMEEVGADK